MTEWSVWVDVEGTFGEGDAERVLEALKPHSPALSFHAQSLETHITVQASSATEALDRGRGLIAEAIGSVTPGTIRRLEVQRQADMEADLEKSNFPDLLGVTEVAGVLGVSRQRVDELTRTHETFPKPAVELAAGPIWERAAITRFVEEWPRKSGRPTKADQQRRLASVPAAMLGIGEGSGVKSLGATNYQANRRAGRLISRTRTDLRRRKPTRRPRRSARS